jgi:hypothetical protein
MMLLVNLENLTPQPHREQGKGEVDSPLLLCAVRAAELLKFF